MQLYATSLDGLWAACKHEGEYLVLARDKRGRGHPWEIWCAAENKELAIQQMMAYSTGQLRMEVEGPPEPPLPAGLPWRLVDSDGQPVRLPCRVRSASGEAATITGFTPPASRLASGMLRVTWDHAPGRTDEYGPELFNLELIVG